jgi:hypothetical protein
MSQALRLAAVTVTTAADGSATAYSETVTGKLSTVRYVKNNYDNGVDFTITSEATGETLWTQADVNASITVAPRQATHSTAGTAALYAAGGTAVLDKIALAGDRVKIVIAQGGNVKSGAFHFVFD